MSNLPNCNIELTSAQKLRYWVKTLRNTTDFYLDGERFFSDVSIKKGRLVAHVIAGETLDETRDLSDLLLSGRKPSWHKGEIYIEVPYRVTMRLLRNRKAIGAQSANTI